MPEIIAERVTAELDGEFVVLLIGMRINKFWLPHKWLPTALAMRRMIRELEQAPSEETGFLGYEQSGSLYIQYWRSFEHLEAYARAQTREHWPAWTDFNRRLKNTRGDVGIWHETYLIAPGRYETVYSGMPSFGLAAAGRRVPATGNRDAARGRLRAPAEAPAHAAE